MDLFGTLVCFLIILLLTLGWLLAAYSEFCRSTIRKTYKDYIWLVVGFVVFISLWFGFFYTVKGVVRGSI